MKFFPIFVKKVFYQKKLFSLKKYYYLTILNKEKNLFQRINDTYYILQIINRI